MTLHRRLISFGMGCVKLTLTINKLLPFMVNILEKLEIMSIWETAILKELLIQLMLRNQSMSMLSHRIHFLVQILQSFI